MKLNIGNGSLKGAADIDVFLLYDDAAIEEARHDIRSKGLRQRRAGHSDLPPGQGKSRAGRSLRRDVGARHGR